MPLDPSKSREALAYSWFRACGVPAPRTAFAEVMLDIPGQGEKQSLGLYTIVEEVDAEFLKRNLGTTEGLMFRPFTPLGIEFAGEQWEPYSGRYRPQRDPTPQEQERLIAFAKLVNTASDEEFAQRIGSFVEVEAFLRYLAANALTANLQSFFALGHNYTLYLDPQTDRFHFIPGDLEYSLANPGAHARSKLPRSSSSEGNDSFVAGVCVSSLSDMPQIQRHHRIRGDPSYPHAAAGSCT
jgi:spore coat protein CotH